MTRTIFSLKHIATIVACLMAVTLTSCIPEDDPIDDLDPGTEQEADIVAFTFEGIDGSADIDNTAHTVSAKAKETVDLTDLVVQFTLSTGATAIVDETPQISKTTENDFTSPVTYEVTSGDGEIVNNWVVTISGNGEAGGDFTKRTFTTVKEVIDFIPEGVFVYEYEDKGWSNDITLFSKAADGSFTFSELNGEPESSSYGDVDNWYVWKGENFHSVNYTNDSKNNITRYWQVRADYPGENLTQSTDTRMGMKSISVNTPYGGTPTAAPGETTDPFSFVAASLNPFLSFITSDNCNMAVFEENASVQGVACKKYSVPAYGGAKTYYYVLDNGFCLQKDGPEGTGSWTDFALKTAETSASSCDAVLQEYYHDSDVYNEPTTIGSMQILTHMHNGPEWIAGNPAGNSGWVIPWTAGGIKYMSLFYELGDTAPHTFTAELDQAQFTDEQRIAYLGKVMQIPYMKVKENADAESEFMRTVFFESDNNDDALAEGVDFGEHYYYIGYDFNQAVLQGMPLSCRISIFWVKVTIV